MKTNQGKEYNYGDILLYKKDKKNIIVIVNDPEQLKKFNFTAKHEDAPIAILPYSDETEMQIISSMKQIKKYDVKSNKNVSVSYEDGTNVIFDYTNEEIICENLIAQREINKEKAVGTWYGLSEKEKEEKKKNTQKKVTKGLAAILAATILAGGLYSCGKNNRFNFGKKINDEMLNPEDPRKTEESVITRSNYTKEAEALFQETIDKNAFILRYQQVANIKWDQELALEVVEFMNGVYPTSMTYMTEENAQAEMVEVLQAVSLLIAGNLNPETKMEDMIDLSQYVTVEKEKVFINNAMIISRYCIQESIGEPMNGKILDESAWSSVNKFSRQYTNSVDQLLHYEFDTINDPDFLTMSAGARYIVGSIFQQINATIPQWSYVERESSEQDTREYNLYYRYFFDDVKKVSYLPEEGPNGTTQYRAYWADENNLCHQDGPYTEDVMFAMAGLSLLEEQRNLGIEANPNIRQLGIQTEIDNRVDDAREELFDLRNTYSISK